jgi:predicted kinase
MDNLSEGTATVEVFQMRTVAVLLAKGLVESVQAQKIADDRVRFDVEFLPEDEETVTELVRLSNAGMYGIEVDAGEFQDAWRKVSSLVDRTLPRRKT